MMIQIYMSHVKAPFTHSLYITKYNINKGESNYTYWLATIEGK